MMIQLTSITVPQTNSSHLKIDSWKMKSPFGIAYLQGRTVSFRDNRIIKGEW